MGIVAQRILWGRMINTTEGIQESELFSTQ